MVFWSSGMCAFDNRTKEYHRELKGIRVLTCPQLIGTLHRPVYTTHYVGRHNIVRVGHTPILDREVVPAVNFLEYGVLQRLVEPLYVTDTVMFVGYTG